MSQVSDPFSASVLKKACVDGCLAQFPLSCLEPRVLCARVPDALVNAGASLMRLQLDMAQPDWCGISGEETTCVMVEHMPQPDLSVNVQNPDHLLANMSSLEWLSSEYARVVEPLTFPSSGRRRGGRSKRPCVIPHGYMVSLPELEKCLGRTLHRAEDGQCFFDHAPGSTFTKTTLRFYLPQFDIIPSARTQFLKGDKVYFGCQEESMRFIAISDKDDLQALCDSLSSELKVTKKVTVACTREAVPLQGGFELEKMTLLPGFELQGYFLKGGILVPLTSQAEVPLHKTLQFKVLPQSILKWNFGDGLLNEPCKMEFDFFRVKDLGGERTLDDPENPLSRRVLRVNIAGIARPSSAQAREGSGGTLDEAENDYQIEWFGGPRSTVRAGDLVLLPRLPPKSSVMHSERFWKAADIDAVANQQPSPVAPQDLDEHICGICMSRPKNRVLVPCGHRICQTCEESWGLPAKPCPFCRTQVDMMSRCL